MSAVPKRPRDDTRSDSRTAQATDAVQLPDVVLQVRGLKVSYGGIQAVKGIDLEVRAGELVTLIGANGAGKTTTLKAITGTQAWSGEINYMGAPTKGQAPFQLLTRGLTMVPEAAAFSHA